MKTIAQYVLCGAVIAIGIGLTLTRLAHNNVPFLEHGQVFCYVGLLLQCAFVGGLVGAGGGFLVWLTQAFRPVPPIAQYDAPQEGVWPPPPILSSNNENDSLL